jgi:hypothetical protein
METIIKEEKCIKYGGIRIDCNSIKLLEGEVVTNVVLKTKIFQINLIEGSVAKKPWVVILIGIALVIMGFLPVPGIIKFLLYGGLMTKGIFMWPLWIAVGMLLIFEVLKKRLILQIVTEKGEERLKFEGKIQKQQIQEFLKIANTQYGYSINSSVEGITF